MNNGFKLTSKVLITTLWCLSWSAGAWTKDDASACVELGALAYDDWTSTDGGHSEGGIYGTAFDPLLVTHDPWGTGIFTFSSCYAGKAEITPNENYADEFEALTIYISRLTLPESCGNEQA